MNALSPAAFDLRIMTNRHESGIQKFHQSQQTFHPVAALIYAVVGIGHIQMDGWRQAIARKLNRTLPPLLRVYKLQIR